MIFSINIQTIDLGKDRLRLNFKAAFDRGIFQLVGPNGAGKTSLLKAAAGFYSFVGECVLDGVSLSRQDRAYKTKLGYCPDSYNFSEQISSREYLDFVSLAHFSSALNTRTQKQQAMEMLLNEAEAIGLLPFLDKTIAELSYGNRKKLLLVASLVGNPLLWLLDEPLNGLDTRGLEWLAEKFKSKAGEACILIVCHDSAWLSQFSPVVHRLA
jgi:ABC-2 type transport system ATP-binding protein